MMITYKFSLKLIHQHRYVLAPCVSLSRGGGRGGGVLLEFWRGGGADPEMKLPPNPRVRWLPKIALLLEFLQTWMRKSHRFTENNDRNHQFGHNNC